MNEEMMHEIDELLLKFDTLEDLEELFAYIEDEYNERDQKENENE